MKEEGILLAISVVLTLLGIYLWRKGNTRESFWEAFIETVGDIVLFELPIFTTFRAWSVFLWLAALILFILFILINVSRLIY
ncbi:hypothetical protein SAMN04488137_3785 [Fictibacillus solisalsi]|uniref:Uncharacterized protein n=1 Tax=Fictibacillus solisalsi TaxID=459525 RepID=A0A1G9ZXK2_9BACL|nr:hypothetical protein [Fictibacillus solisalsi]SDN25621.1 hypothetical protein SAMN04488137_3785 [Fictibacillus solisalsi]